MVDVLQPDPSDGSDVIGRPRLAFHVLGSDLDQGVMELDAALGIAADAVDHSDDLIGADGDAGLLQHLPRRGLADGLAQLLPAAGQAPFALARRLAPLDQQHLVATPDHHADTDERTFRIGTAHGDLCLSTGHGAEPKHGLVRIADWLQLDVVTGSEIGNRNLSCQA